MNLSSNYSVTYTFNCILNKHILGYLFHDYSSRPFRNQLMLCNTKLSKWLKSQLTCDGQLHRLHQLLALDAHVAGDRAAVARLHLLDADAALAVLAAAAVVHEARLLVQLFGQDERVRFAGHDDAVCAYG